MPYFNIQDILISCIAALIILPIHEWAHAYTAHKLGDNTAYYSGRMTMNPLAHLDPIGFICLVVAGFGWARPVPVDMRYFKHPKSGMALTALAGPVSNLALAYLALVVRALLLGVYYRSGLTVLLGVVNFCGTVAVLSIGLGIFNLIPFPPLDGSKVLAVFLPDRAYYTLMRYEFWGTILLMLLLWSGLLDAPLSAARNWVLDLLLQGAAWPYFLLT